MLPIMERNLQQVVTYRPVLTINPHLEKCSMTNKSLMKLARISALVAMISSIPAVAGAATVRGFEGTSQLDNCALGECFRPPDTMGAVGTTQYLETTNGSITIYNKATGAVQSRVDMPGFWTAAGLPGGAGG